MRLGKLFSAVVKLPILPVAIIADVVSLGANASAGDGFVTEKAIKIIADDLDEVTD